MIKHSSPTIGEEEAKAVGEVIKSGFIARGKKNRELEKAFSKFLGVRNSVTVNSGTAALHLSLLALGVSKGDEVILPSGVCISVANAVRYTGATPVLVDIKEDLNVSPREAEKKLGRKTKCIIVPHMYGLPADMDELLSLGVPVIEDCAHAIGAKYKKKKVGTIGDLATFSFFAVKMLTCGEGGMVIARNKGVLKEVKELRNYRYDREDMSNYDYKKLRYNYCLTDIQAAIALEQLKKLPRFIKRRNEIAKKYTKAFSTLGVGLPPSPPDRERTFFRYVLKTRVDSQLFTERLVKKGVHTSTVVQPIHRYLGLKRKDFPVTEEVLKKTLSVPIYPSLTDEEVEKVIKAVSEVLG